MRLLKTLAWAGVGVAAVALVRDTRYQGQDFEVVWSAGRALLGGEDPYAVATAPGMVFKYPPWILPFLLPLSLLPLELAKWIWGAIQVFSLFAVCVWLRREALCRPWLIGAVAASFWGIWAVHALDGQVVLPVLAAALWGWTYAKRGRIVAGAGVILALSTKVFWLLALVGFKRGTGRRFIGVPAVLAATAAAIVLGVAVSASYGGRVGDTFFSWMNRASSGGAQLDPGKIRGEGNQGLPAAVIRAIGATTPSVGADLAAVGVVAFLLAAVGVLFAGQTDETGAWAIGLALAAAAHPLAWVHTYALAFPACVLATERAWIERAAGAWAWWRVALAVLSVCFVALSTRKLFGPAGAALELGSARAWGSLVAAGVIASFGPEAGRAAFKGVAPIRTLR